MSLNPSIPNSPRRRPVIASVVGGLWSLTSTFALAEQSGHFYGALHGGVGALADSATEFSTGGQGDVEFDSSFTGGGALGYTYGQWRFEGELSYRTNETSSAANTLPTGSDQGDFSSLTVAANVLYEFDLLGGERATTYLGLGLAYIQEIDFDFEQGEAEVSYSDSDVGFQLIGGATYKLTRRWDLTTDVRYLRIGSVDLDGERTTAGSVSADYDHWSVNLGLRYRFR